MKEEEGVALALVVVVTKVLVVVEMVAAMATVTAIPLMTIESG